MLPLYGLPDGCPCVVGVIEVSFEEDSDGYVTLVAYPNDSDKKPPQSVEGDCCTSQDSHSPPGVDSAQLDSEQEGTHITSRTKQQLYVAG